MLKIHLRKLILTGMLESGRLHSKSARETETKTHFQRIGTRNKSVIFEKSQGKSYISVWNEHNVSVIVNLFAVIRVEHQHTEGAILTNSIDRGIFRFYQDASLMEMNYFHQQSALVGKRYWKHSLFFPNTSLNQIFWRPTFENKMKIKKQTWLTIS